MEKPGRLQSMGSHRVRYDWRDLAAEAAAAPWKKSYDQPKQHIQKQRHYFANKGPSSQSYGFSSSHVQMWDLDHKESWAPKTWYFLTVVLEKTLESPLDCKEIQPVHPKGNQSWIFIGKTDAEAPIFGHLMQRTNWLEKTLMLGKFSSVQSLSHVWLFANPWTAACQTSLSITMSQSLLKFTSVESVMPSSHLILGLPFLLLPSILPSIREFYNEPALSIRWPKYWSFSFSISPSNEYSGLISFRSD